MARGVSEIVVKILGDARGLTTALGAADRGIGGLALKAGGALLALGAIKQGFDFVDESLDETDRLGDALARLDAQLGPELAQRVDSIAGSMADLGLSRQDVDELAANFADIATATKEIDDQTIADLADEVVATAAAVSQLGDQSPDEVVALIGKAADGSEKAAKALGVSLLEDADASTQLANILDQLKPKLDAVTEGSTDLEGQQRRLDAQIETLQANVGQLVEGPLTDLLGWINDTIELIPSAVDGFGMLGDAMAGAAREALSPFARLNDALGELGDTIRSIPFVGEIFGGGGAAGVTESSVRRANDLFNERNLQSRP